MPSHTANQTPSVSQMSLPEGSGNTKPSKVKLYQEMWFFFIPTELPVFSASSRPAGEHAVPAFHPRLHSAGGVEVRQHPLLPAALRPGARRARLHGDAQRHRPGPPQVGGA